MIATLWRFVGTRVVTAAIKSAARITTVRTIHVPARIAAGTIKIAVVEAFHVAARSVVATSPRWTIVARHAGTASAVGHFIVRRSIAVIAEAGRRAPTIRSAALRFPTA